MMVSLILMVLIIVGVKEIPDTFPNIAPPAFFATGFGIAGLGAQIFVGKCGSAFRRRGTFVVFSVVGGSDSCREDENQEKSWKYHR